MIREAIDKIIEISKAEQFEIDGRKYTGKGIIPVKMPMPKELTVHTLSGIVDYLKNNIDAMKDSSLVIHVASPTEVNLYGFFNKFSFCERPEFVRAVFDPPNIQSGQYTSLESFIIGLQAYFVPTETSASILKIIGNLKDETVMQFGDDGITQGVTAKTGISLSKIVPIPNPITLKPYRTFPEIDQPESLFVFRIRQQEKQPPACGLWEADNKLWKVIAVKRIADWLEDKVGTVPIIA